jgi:protease I
MASNVNGKRVAILTENGFEEVELTHPKKALEEAGATVHIVSPQNEKVKAWDHDHWSGEVNVDVHVSDVNIENYDMLIIPGGVINPDKMRTDVDCVSLVQQFLEAGKPVAAICHGPQLLIETGMISGRKMTSYHSIKTDLINAGVIWEDKEVVVDNGIITSRSPKDLEAFNSKLIEELAEGVHTTTAQFTHAD